MIVVAVAQVKPELDVRGHVPAEAQQPLEHAGANLAEPSGRDALEHRELQSRVPLESQLIVRDGGQDLADLLEDPSFVDRLDRRLVLGVDERADRRGRRRQRDLEADVRRDDVVALELGERPVGRDRRVGEAEVVEGDVLDALAGPQPQRGQCPVRAVAGWADLELRKRAEHRVLPEDPVRARPGLAVRQPAQAVAERARGPAEHLVGAAQGDDADEVSADDRRPAACSRLQNLGGQRYVRGHPPTISTPFQSDNGSEGRDLPSHRGVPGAGLREPLIRSDAM